MTYGHYGKLENHNFVASGKSQSVLPGIVERETARRKWWYPEVEKCW